MTLKSSKPTKIARASLVAVTLAVLVTACASQGPTDNPIKRKFSWFSYLEGGDIRAVCGPGASSRYRMVYNGVFGEQVRTYDLSAAGRLDVSVIEAADVSAFSVSKLSGLLNPWRGKAASRQLSQVEVSRIIQALDRDGAFAAPAVGTELSSKGFFWTMAACHEGRYHFTAVAWPSPAWDAATFDDVVFELDPSPIAVNPPRKTVLTRINKTDKRRKSENEFHTKVGENGLFGVVDLGK